MRWLLRMMVPLAAAVRTASRNGTIGRHGSRTRFIPSTKPARQQYICRRQPRLLLLRPTGLCRATTGTAVMITFESAFLGWKEQLATRSLRSCSRRCYPIDQVGIVRLLRLRNTAAAAAAGGI